MDTIGHILPILLFLGINEHESFWETIDWKPILIGKLMLLLSSACQITSKIRPVTVDLAITLLLRIAVPSNPTQHRLDDKHLALLEQAKEESIMVARTFFKVIMSMCYQTKYSITLTFFLLILNFSPKICF